MKTGDLNKKKEDEGEGDGRREEVRNDGVRKLKTENHTKCKLTCETL